MNTDVERSNVSEVEGGNVSAVPAELQDSWRYLMGAGVLLAVLGVIAIFTPLITGLTLSIVLGGLLVVGAFAHVAHAFAAQGWKGSIWQILLAAVYAAAGVSLLVNPLVGLTTLTLLVIAYFLVDGIVEVVMGLRMRSEPRWAWVVASGAVSLLLAGLLWAGFPSTALWVVGLMFGVNLFTSGLSLVAIAMAGRQAVSTSQEQSPETQPGGV